MQLRAFELGKHWETRMGFFSSPSRGGDATARQAQGIISEWLRRNAEKIAADVRSGGARAVREIADHLEAAEIRAAP